jgi:hypothetical protein
MALSNENSPNVAVIDLGSITADADTYGLYLPMKAKIKSAYLVNGAGISQSDSDYGVVKLMNGSTVIAQHSTKLTDGTSALVANTPVAMTKTEANTELAAGAYLKVNYDETGTYAMTSAKVFIEWFPV